MEQPLCPKDYGAVVDGVTDDGEAFKTVLDFAALLNRPIRLPEGTMLVEDTAIFSGFAPDGFVPPEGITIFGAGPESVIRFKCVNFGAFYGLSIRNGGIRLRDLTIEVDKDDNSWTAAAAIVEQVEDIRFTRVVFRGVATRTGHYGVQPLNSDIDGLVFDQCHFESLDFGYLKGTSDVSTQKNILVADCTGEDCTEILEFNSPGLIFGDTEEDSPEVTNLLTAEGGPLTTVTHHIGQVVSSALFPPGTTIVGIDQSPPKITMSANAIADADEVRFSAGGCTDGVVRNLRARNIGQWAVGLAKCENWQVEVHGEDVEYELVHIEDHSAHVDVVAGGIRCNLADGVVGSPCADNGLVNVIAGAHDIRVRLASADLRESTEKAGLCVQAGGIAGTTGTQDTPYDIFLAGLVYANFGTRAVVAYGTHIDFQDFRVVSPDPASKAGPVFYLPDCTFAGSCSVVNPAVLFNCPDTSIIRGTLDRLTLFTSERCFPDLVWASGFYPVVRNAPPVAHAISFYLTSYADGAASWRDLCPAPHTLVGRFMRQYHGASGNHAYEGGTFDIRGGVLNSTPAYQVSGGTLELMPRTPPAPEETQYGWQIDDGILQFRAYSADQGDCAVQIHFDATLFADV